jgi:hypothetical protein
VTSQREGSLDRTTCLYHYTTAEGLEGILKTRSLWAHDVAFMNDWQEIQFGADPLIVRMREYLSEHPPDRDKPVAKEFEENIRLVIMDAALDSLRKFTSSERQFHPNYMDEATYVACLSEEYDDLGQWRAYGKRGYAIGLTIEGLTRAAPPPLLGQVKYGEPAVRDLCDSVIGYFETRRVGAHPRTYGYFDTVNRLLPQLALIKHDAFHQEREWRLVVSPQQGRDRPEVKVRSTASGLVPYVEWAFEPPYLAEIVIGPGGDLHSERAVRMLLRARGFVPEQLQITQSRAPYRV